MNTLALPNLNILKFPRGGAQQALDRVSRMFRGALGDAGVFAPAMGGATQASSNPLAAVPWVAQWKFNNNGNDSVGANTLTNNNGATFTTGLLGGATGATQLVNASNQYWSITDNAALSMGIGVDYLISLWFYLDSITVSCPLFGKGIDGTAAGHEYSAYVWSFDGKIYVDVSSGTTIKEKGHSVAPSIATWHLFILWYDSAAQTLNLNLDNGTTQTLSSVAATQDGTGNFRIGWVPFIATKMDGRIDNVCIAKGAGAAPTQTILDALWNGGAGTETLT